MDDNKKKALVELLAHCIRMGADYEANECEEIDKVAFRGDKDLDEIEKYWLVLAKEIDRWADPDNPIADELAHKAFGLEFADES